jgi:hypothetical protein
MNRQTWTCVTEIVWLERAANIEDATVVGFAHNADERGTRNRLTSTRTLGRDLMIHFYCVH